MNLDRGCFLEPDVIELAGMDESGSRMLLEPDVIKLAAMHETGSWMLLRNPTLSSWQEWMNLEPGCFLARWQGWMNLDRGCFLEPDVIELARMDKSGSRMLFGTRCY